MQYGGGGYGQRQPGAPKARVVMAEARKSYVNKWQTDLMGAPCANPGFCLYADLPSVSFDMVLRGATADVAMRIGERPVYDGRAIWGKRRYFR